MLNKNETACRLLCVTEKMYRSISDSNLETFGIHASQHKVLLYLADRGENYASQKEIAETFGISPSAVAVTLKKLENDGYITRKVLDMDNRVNNVVLTEKAIELVTKTKITAEEFCNNVFADFSDIELETLCALLDKIGCKL